MNALTNALKSEIARVARKELKDELTSLRKVTTGHRSEIAALKRDLKTLRAQLKASQRGARPAATVAATDPPANRGRKPGFSAEALAAQRAKLGLSQVEMAQLLGASALSVHKWESGKVQPRAAQLARIFAVRKLGKREAAARLTSA